MFCLLSRRIDSFYVLGLGIEKISDVYFSISNPIPLLKHFKTKFQTRVVIVTEIPKDIIVNYTTFQ